MSDDDDYVLASRPPRWLMNHQELHRRGISITDLIKPRCLYRTSPFSEETQYAVKILAEGFPEAEMYKELLQDRDPRNHILPVELLDTETRPILLMPCLSEFFVLLLYKWRTSDFLKLFLQLVEGVEYLHDHNITHGDICHGNVLVAKERNVHGHPEIQPGRVYIIDLETVRRLPAPPGVQPALPLPQAQCRPPIKDMTQLDPYSWDVYCLGRFFGYLLGRVYRKRTVPLLVRSYHRWLVGNERGCEGVCRCRPTVRRARQALSIAIRVFCVSEWCGDILTRARNFMASLTSRQPAL
ncbi:hypothetical protein GY45DRAFT_1289828 [Cubamyces sp. BRFM 1775]|nr:hypothetical protein GY45DRAFT_1289828 [Cubamyces sp. BRFM 1775]